MKAIQIFNAKVAILLFVIIGTLTWIVYENWSSTSNDIGPSINLNQNVSANGGSRINELPVIKATAQTPLVQATNDLQITYRPQQRRPVKRYTGPVGSNNIISGHAPGWWLYASSEAEVQWLDYYGYPTPAEEAKLANSSDFELASLAEGGDLNAKAHQVSRLAIKAFLGGDLQLMAKTVARAQRLLMEGGPYQAFVISAAYGDMFKAYAALPDADRTAEKQSALNRFDSTANYAHSVGTMYSDISFTRLWNTRLQGERELLGLANMNNVSPMQLANSLGSRTATRNSLGLPTILLPRPEPPDLPNNSPDAVILERY